MREERRKPLLTVVQGMARIHLIIQCSVNAVSYFPKSKLTVRLDEKKIRCPSQIAAFIHQETSSYVLERKYNMAPPKTYTVT